VVHVKEETNLPGGAGNVIMNLASLKAKVLSCGIIGNDSNGKNLLAYFNNNGVQTQGMIMDPLRLTTVKSRVIAEHQQVVRFDYEQTQAVSPSIQNQIKKFIEKTIPWVDAVILSDYGKGVIIQPILETSIALARKYKKPICVDPKIEHFLLYQRVTCITPNILEARQGVGWTQTNTKNIVPALGKEILKKLKSESVLITEGEDGMTLFEKNKVIHIPTQAQEVFDVTGAGDTVIAVLTLALACGASLLGAATLSNLAAGIVVGKLGTATLTIKELRQALKRFPRTAIGSREPR
jgi:D-beta-D-heptose 7-phosphate kinase/D-beta-D-heptose 1-phosphate adenosyltransferase